MKNLVVRNTVVFVSIVIGQIATAQDETKEVSVAITPAAIPKAALENPLIPPRLETTRGNAALLYLRAAAMVGKLNSEMADVRKKFGKYLDSPADEFAIEDARKDVEPFASALGEIRLAARRRQCEWQLPIEESGTQLYYVELPEMHALRDLGRVLAVRIRIEIHDGRIDDAIDSLQTGFAMGQQIADAPFLINSLVGVAVLETMSQRVLELAQTENSPNLYWSLTALPRPLVDMRQSMQFESESAMMVFPELARADNVSGESSRVDFENFVNRFEKLAVDSTNTEGPEYQLRKRLIEMLNGEAAMRDVGTFLEAEGGFSKEAIAKMVPTHAVMIRERILFTRLRDAMFVHSFLQFDQAQAGFDAWGDKYRQLQKEGKGLRRASSTATTDRTTASHRSYASLRHRQRRKVAADAKQSHAADLRKPSRRKTVCVLAQRQRSDTTNGRRNTVSNSVPNSNWPMTIIQSLATEFRSLCCPSGSVL